MGKTAASLRALMGACPSMAIIHVGEKTTVIKDVDRNEQQPQKQAAWHSLFSNNTQTK